VLRSPRKRVLVGSLRVVAHSAAHSLKDRVTRGSSVAAFDLDMSRERVYEILDRVVAAYTQCSSYRDWGTLKSTTCRSLSENGVVTEEGEFSTAYIRPDRFRFDYLTSRSGLPIKSERSVFWTQGNRVKSWRRNGTRTQSFLDIEHALFQLSSDSGVSSRFVPRLLLPDGASNFLRERFGDSDFVGIELSEGFDCFKLQFKSTASHVSRVWIDTCTFLVRRLETDTLSTLANFEVAELEEIRDRMISYGFHSQFFDKADWYDSFKDSRSILTLNYRPEIDCPINREVFNFKPPSTL